MAWRVRRAGVADAEGIAALHAASWRTAYRGLVPDRRLGRGLDGERRRHWRAALAKAGPRDVVLVAGDGERLLGFVAIWVSGPSSALIDNLHVLPALRGQRIGAQLLRAAARRLRSLRVRQAFLWAFVANDPAIRFYRRLGARGDRRSFTEFPPATAPCLRLMWQRLDPLCR